MAVTDPYAVLGVPPTASRAEIARAYRALAKRHHPDVGAPPTAAMTRINEAWHVLSDPARRARWDQEHRIVAAPVPWSAPTPGHRAPRVTPMPRRTAPDAPPSRLDSGWIAAGVVAGVAVLVALVMLVVATIAAPPDSRERFADFTGGGLRFAYPARWQLAPGAEDQPADHRIVTHLVSFSAPEEELCTDFAEPCPWTGDALPSGTASVLVTAWQGGTPPVEEPVVRRPYGLHADAVIGGAGAAFDLQRVDEDRYLAWWQLSPPSFPDRWFEVHAHLRGGEIERDRLLSDIEAVLDTLEFAEGS